jgi:hypothetical protein
MHINATFADGKVTETDREMFILPAKEDGASDAVFFHILVRFRRSLANVLNVVSGFVREFIKYISFIRDGSSFVTSLVSKFARSKFVDELDTYPATEKMQFGPTRILQT